MRLANAWTGIHPVPPSDREVGNLVKKLALSISSRHLRARQKSRNFALPKRRALRTYKVKECFYTLQGEGAQAGRPAVFLRFTGCNLWSGREEDRHTAICKFCDTDFVGTNGKNGGRYTPVQCADLVQSLWPGGGAPYVVCTGGEPLLQLDEPLITELHARGFEIAVETNGTLAIPKGIDWVCVSPKADAELVVFQGDELKLVYPQAEELAQPTAFLDLDFKHFFLQPKDESGQNHVPATVAYCLANPSWKISLQTHKLMGIE